jgi:hypothetical protein
MPGISVVMIVFALLAVALTLTAGKAWRNRHRASALFGFLCAALCLSLGLLAGAIIVGTKGYRALTREVVAATIRTEPLAETPQRFRATVTMADGSLKMFELAGDAVYIDAHVLKWRPIVNVLGLHTVYELDRIAGRYNAVRDEQTRERTVFSLATSKPFNSFELARRYWVLRPFVDAQYGSATFIQARTPATWEVRVSTTGLLVRPVETR